MAAPVKMTFTLDAVTAGRLNQAAEQLQKPKSQVVRDAIREFHERLGRLSEAERVRLLRAFDELIPAIPARPLGDVDREIEEIRRARHGGVRRTRR